MQFSDIYREFILTKILLDKLEEGTIPTADMLKEELNNILQQHTDLSIPLIVDSDYFVKRHEESSASKYNDFLGETKRDIEAAYEGVVRIILDTAKAKSKWQSILTSLERRLIDLNSRIETLLLLKRDTAGYLHYVEDNFVDTTKIDLDQTTAKVDIDFHQITINKSNSVQNLINTNSLEPSRVDFNVLTREHLISSRRVGANSPHFAVSDINRHWQHRVYASKDTKMTGELRINFSKTQTISRVYVKLHSSNTIGSMLVSVLYSTDGTNYQPIPIDSYTRNVDKSTAFAFPAIEALSIKLFMTKLGADTVDNGMFVYEFGAESIKFFGEEELDTENGNLFVSKELQPKSSTGIVMFNKVALETCQETPENTNIKYWIIAKNDSVTTAPIRIDPINMENKIAASTVDLGTVVDHSSSLVLLDKSDSESTSYFSKYENILETDFVSLLGIDNSTLFSINSSISDRLKHKITLYRNKGETHGTQLVASRNVRNAPRGWKYDETGSYLETEIVVKNPNGLRINLGPNGALLNGQFVKFYVAIPAGRHTFKTHVQNIAELPENDFGPFASDSELEAADPLYPYNHKLIIEGVNYDSSYTGNKTYIGVDIYCESIAKQVSPFDLVFNTTDEDYTRFAIDTDQNENFVILVKYDPSDSNKDNELFLIEYSTDAGLFHTLVLKAQLISNDTAITPTLSAYRLKVGV